MVITFAILTFLLVIINCEFDPYRQRLVPKDFEKKIFDRFSKDKDLNRRRFSFDSPKYIGPTSILTFSNEYIFEVFSVKNKSTRRRYFFCKFTKYV